MNNDSDHPAWWDENQRIRQQMNLAEYVPPRFLDGTYTHEITDKIEGEYGCSVHFFAYNSTYPDDWTVAIDDREAFKIGRYRDSNGNTVFEMCSEEFREKLLTALE